MRELRDFILTAFPSNRYPNGLNTYKYFWQYKLNGEQYECLKSALINLNLRDNIRTLSIEPCGKEYGKVAKWVAFYVSEWYKRESESLEGDKCLESIGLSSSYSQKIWRYSDLPDFFLHQNENENQMRQISMCALGGLPLSFVNDSPRFRDFVNSLSDIYNKEDETTDDDIEKVVNCFDDNNGVFKRSLKSGSCKEYLMALGNYLESRNNSDLPFNESDINNSPFNRFLTLLQQGYDDDLPKRFFHSEIRIWTYDFIEEGDESKNIESEFYVRIGCGKNENKNVITIRELSKLGVTLPSNTDYFNLSLKITQKDGTSITPEEKRIFFRIGGGCDDFCGAYGSDITTSINFFEVKDISLFIESGDYKKEIKAFSMPQYLELYSTGNYYLWTTKKDSTAKKVLFYDKDIFEPMNNDLDIQLKSVGENYWGWIYLKDTITLHNKYSGDTEVIALDASENILVVFDTKQLKKNIVLNTDGCIQCVINGDIYKPVHLLYYSHPRSHDLSIICDGLTGQELMQNYKLEYRPLNKNRYTEWTNENVPTQGFLSLRINCRDNGKKKRTWKDYVYFIPEHGPIIQRNLENNFIYFKGQQVSPLNGNLKQFYNEEDNKYEDKTDSESDSTTISFRIGDEDNHILIDVYRAFQLRQIWNNGKLIKNKIENQLIPIAYILHKNIIIKVVNENGYEEHCPQSNEFFQYFGDPGIISYIFTCDNSNIYRWYIYLTKNIDHSGDTVKSQKIERYRDSNTVRLNVSDDYINEYVFYYWSGKMEDAPIKLEMSYIQEREYQFIIPHLQDMAIVFQSLKDCSPNFYFRPFYDATFGWNAYLSRFDHVRNNYIVRCFQYAVEHKVYFSIFPAFKVLQNRNDFTEFIRYYIKTRSYYLSSEDLTNLTRLAKELAMDWFFVNRAILFSGLREDCKIKMRDCMKMLLLRSPIEQGEHAYSKRFIDRFFQDSRVFIEQRGQNRPRSLYLKFLFYLDNNKQYGKQLDGNNNIQNRIDFLNELVKKNNNIFKTICNKLNL